MRLLFRHIKNSVLRAPYQTIVLLLTILFSAIIFASISEVRFAVREESYLGDDLKNGNAEIVINPSAEGASRYLTVAQTGLGEEELVSGYFVLPVEYGGKSELGGATDFSTVGNVFTFDFLEYDTFVTEGERDSAIFISRDYAERYDLELGQSITVGILGREKKYTVRGIHRYAFFGGYETLVSAEGALGALASVSPVFSTFDGKNPPCSAIFLHLQEGENEGEKIEALNERLSAYGWLASERKYADEGFARRMTDFLLLLLLVLSMAIAWVLVGFSLRILGEKRQEEMRTFLLSGMSQRSVFLAFCAEIFLYLLIGTAFGLGGAYLFLRGIRRLGLRYALLRLTWKGVLVAIASEIAVGAVALWTYKNSTSKWKAPKKEGSAKGLLAFGILFTGSLLAGFFVPVTWKIYVALFTLVGGLGTIMLSAAPYCKGVSSLLSKRFDKEGKGPDPHLVLAAKNCANVRELHNVYRILSMILSMFLVLATGFSFFSKQLDAAYGYFRCDYILLNAGETVVAPLKDLEEVEGVCAAFVGKARVKDGPGIPVIDADPEFFAGDGTLPEGNGIFLAKEVAALHGWELGDEVPLELFGGEYVFILTGYCDNSYLYAYIDADYYGFRKNTVLVKTGGASEDALAALTESVGVYGAVIGEPAELLKQIIRIAEAFNELMTAYILLLLALACIGCVNLVWICYSRRRKQFSDLITVGMTKGEIKKMIAMEGGILLLSVLLVSLLGGGLLCVALDSGMQSFGYRIM